MCVDACPSCVQGVQRFFFGVRGGGGRPHAVYCAGTAVGSDRGNSDEVQAVASTCCQAPAISNFDRILQLSCLVAKKTQPLATHSPAAQHAPPQASHAAATPAPWQPGLPPAAGQLPAARTPCFLRELAGGGSMGGGDARPLYQRYSGYTDVLTDQASIPQGSECAASTEPPHPPPSPLPSRTPTCHGAVLGLQLAALALEARQLGDCLRPPLLTLAIGREGSVAAPLGL